MQRPRRLAVEVPHRGVLLLLLLGFVAGEASHRTAAAGQDPLEAGRQKLRLDADNLDVVEYDISWPTTHAQHSGMAAGRTSPASLLKRDAQASEHTWANMQGLVDGFAKDVKDAKKQSAYAAPAEHHVKPAAVNKVQDEQEDLAEPDTGYRGDAPVSVKTEKDTPRDWHSIALGVKRVAASAGVNGEKAWERKATADLGEINAQAAAAEQSFAAQQRRAAEAKKEKQAQAAFAHFEKLRHDGAAAAVMPPARVPGAALLATGAAVPVEEQERMKEDDLKVLHQTMQFRSMMKPLARVLRETSGQDEADLHDMRLEGPEPKLAGAMRDAIHDALVHGIRQAERKHEQRKPLAAKSDLQGFETLAHREDDVTARVEEEAAEMRRSGMNDPSERVHLGDRLLGPRSPEAAGATTGPHAPKVAVATTEGQKATISVAAAKAVPKATGNGKVPSIPAAASVDQASVDEEAGNVEVQQVFRGPKTPASSEAAAYRPATGALVAVTMSSGSANVTKIEAAAAPAAPHSGACGRGQSTLVVTLATAAVTAAAAAAGRW